jgi:hypothetical protein
MQRRLFSSLKAYVGQTRSRALVAELAAAGIGECVTRGQLPPRRTSWFYDNGAFEDFQAGRAFDTVQFTRDLRAIRDWQVGGVGRGCLEGQPMTAPDFIVLPDVVGQGEASLRFSLQWEAQCADAGVPLYLAVQNGMEPAAIASLLKWHPRIHGLFVGGDLAWKLETAAAWVQVGRRTGRAVHVGRVGTVDRVEWASAIGATSIDSSFPLWTRNRLGEFLQAVA